MIDRVHFENFKSLANVTLDLGRLTVLVGANGCGKTSVLQGMSLLSQKARIFEEVTIGNHDSPISPVRLMYRARPGKDEHPRMASDGSGLASALAWMKGAAEDELAQITADLRQVVPGVKRIRTLRERVPHRRMEKLEIDGQPIWRPVDESQIGDRFELEFDDGSVVPADLLSEGTVLALACSPSCASPTGATCCWSTTSIAGCTWARRPAWSRRSASC